MRHRDLAGAETRRDVVHFRRRGAPRPARPASPARGRWGEAFARLALYSPRSPDDVDGRRKARPADRQATSPTRPRAASTRRRPREGDRPTESCDPPNAASCCPAHGDKVSGDTVLTHPARLETRTKESNMRASQRVETKPHGVAKANWCDPRRPRALGATPPRPSPRRRLDGG